MYFNNKINDTNINKDLSKKKAFNYKPLIIVPIVLVLIVLIIILNNKKEAPKYYLTLNGNKDIILYTNSDYIEDGFKAYDSNGNTYNDEVIVTGSVNTSVSGNYTIAYEFKDIVETRNITIIPSTNNTTILGLYGDILIITPIGKNFEDPGYYVLDSNHSTEEMRERVKIESNIDINKKGTYKKTYSITTDEGINIVKERIIVVTDAEFTLDYNPKEITNKEIHINGLITNTYFDYILLPDGTKETNRNISYTVKENNSYKFKLFLKDGTSHEETIIINNIDKEKPSGSCKATINKNTEIEVKAKDNTSISKYTYIIENKEYDSTNSKYNITGIYKNINVILYDAASNTEEITCEIIDEGEKEPVTPSVGEWPEYITPIDTPKTTPKHFLENMEFSKKVRYILYYPDDLDLSKKNPLVVYIHGAGECGANTNKMIRENGKFVNNMKTGKYKNAVYLAPQCNCVDGNFYVCEKDFKSLIDKIVTEYNINTKKISLTGISSGGSSAQRLLSKNPGFFSGAALLAPYITTGGADKYKGYKIAVFIGTLDKLHDDGKAHSEILRQKGVDIKFFSVKNVGHVLESSVYDGTNVVEWLIAQEKK